MSSPPLSNYRISLSSSEISLLSFYLCEYEKRLSPFVTHFLIDDALRSVVGEWVSYGFGAWEMLGGRERGLLRSSLFLAFSSLTRLARMEAYSFCW